MYSHFRFLLPKCSSRQSLYICYQRKAKSAHGNRVKGPEIYDNASEYTWNKRLIASNAESILKQPYSPTVNGNYEFPFKHYFSNLNVFFSTILVLIIRCKSVEKNIHFFLYLKKKKKTFMEVSILETNTSFLYCLYRPYSEASVP